MTCPECGGSGMRSCDGRELECFDCAGEGMWPDDPDEETISTITLDDLRKGNLGCTDSLRNPLPHPEERKKAA